MKHSIPLAVLMFIISLPTISQSKFGNATMDELKMTTYEKDSTAEAVVLHKDVYLAYKYDNNKGFLFEYTQREKIKILKPEGHRWADQHVRYYVKDRSTAEEIVGLSATAYNLENGKIVKTKMSKDNIFEEDMEGKWKQTKFTIPGAKVGSVIEYKYTISSPFFYELRDFVFQSSIPTDYVKCEAIIPEYWIYNVNFQGDVSLVSAKKEQENLSFSIRDKYQTHDHRCTGDKYLYIGHDLPAIKNEPHLWTVDDYIATNTFELKATNFPGSFHKNFTTSWEEIDKDFKEMSGFGGNLKHSGWFKNEITPTPNPNLEQASEIRQLIANKVQWNDTNAAYTSKLKNALEKGVGNSADMNFLLINALTAGGIDAFPVLLRTRKAGRLPYTHPSASAFNYMITGIQIDTMLYYTDASDKFSGWNILPQKSMVQQARAIRGLRGDWVDLSTISTGTVFLQTAVQFKDSQAEMTVNEVRKGMDAYNARHTFATFDNEEKFIEKMQEKENCEIDNFEITGYSDIDDQFRVQYLKKTDLPLTGDHFYYTLPLANLYTENPFKAETRSFPINFDYLRAYIQALEIEIPDGYEVAELPNSERIILENNTLSYIYTIRVVNNKILVNTKYQLRELTFLTDQYDILKEFFAKMLLKNKEQIVFKKTENQGTLKADNNEIEKTI